MSTTKQSEPHRFETFSRNFVGSLGWLQSSMPLTALGLVIVGIPLLLVDKALVLSKTAIAVVFVIVAIDAYHGFRRERKLLQDLRTVLIEQLGDTTSKGKDHK
jgi:hypothetical protein